MRLKPHTYRRLAWVACWTAYQADPNSWLDSSMIPAGHEIKCLKRLLSLYQTFLKEYDNFASKDPEIRKKLLESDDENIQLLLDVFPSQSSRLAFAKDFEPVFYISEIVRYCLDGTLDDYKDYKGYKRCLLIGLQNCFGGPARSFSPSLLSNLASFYHSWCKKGHNFQTSNYHALEYCDLYRDLYSCEFPFSPEQQEERRRMKISKTKRQLNENLTSKKQKHVKNILLALQKGKAAYSSLPAHQRKQQEKPTCQRICKQYFEQHKEELIPLQITSARTLENLCSRKNGKPADAVRKQKNAIQVYRQIHEPILYSHLQIYVNSADLRSSL